MINYYELIKNNPQYFKQFCCKDLLFLNYDCPVEVKKAAKWSEHNYVYFVLSGKKTLHTPETSVTLTQGSIAFVKKGACIVEQYFDEAFCIVVFIIPDSFILSFLKDFAPGEKSIMTSTQPIISVYDDEMIKGFYHSIVPYFVSKESVPETLLELSLKSFCSIFCIILQTLNYAVIS